MESDVSLRSERAVPYLRLLPLNGESLTIEQAQNIWQAASIHTRHQLVAACLGWGWNIPWSADPLYVSHLLEQVEIFWHDTFAATLCTVTGSLTGLHATSVVGIHEIAYRLVTLLTAVCKHTDAICFAFVYAHPKGVAALQAYSAHATRLEVAQ